MVLLFNKAKSMEQKLMFIFSPIFFANFAILEYIFLSISSLIIAPCARLCLHSFSPRIFKYTVCILPFNIMARYSFSYFQNLEIEKPM
jgi:hypothetical protein